MSVTLQYDGNVTVRETLETNVTAVASNGAIVTHSGFNKSAALTSATTATPVTKVAAFQATLSGGLLTIDLTSLTGTNGVAVTFSGLKIQAYKFANPSTNANSITVAAGASNGYLLGGAAFSWILAPGQEIMGFTNDASPDVAGGAKTIDLSGTLVQALNVILVAG